MQNSIFHLIMLTCLCNVELLTPHFYIVKLGLQGYIFFSFFTLKHSDSVRYNTHLYCLAVQAGFYSDAVECLTATQEILVRSSAGTKGV